MFLALTQDGIHKFEEVVLEVVQTVISNDNIFSNYINWNKGSFNVT